MSHFPVDHYRIVIKCPIFFHSSYFNCLLVLVFVFQPLPVYFTTPTLKA